MKDKIILHVDANNFFVSCELLVNPDLKGKPVCVLSNNDGCVVSRSNEAKKLGVPMGIPHFMAKKQFDSVIYLSSDFALYKQISDRLMQYLCFFSEKVEIYSIDEAFIDITGLDKVFNCSFLEVAKKLKQEIFSYIGINVSVGISTSKMLAKLATHKAKKSDGVYIIEKSNIENELSKVPIEDLWGVGKNTARALKSLGIFYANQIIEKDDSLYKSTFGKRGMELKYELLGESVLPLIYISEKPKSIQKSRAFPSFTSDKNFIKTELMFHLHNVCKKLRYYSLKTKTVSVMLRTKDFQVFYRELNLDFFTNAELVLSEKIISLFDKMYSSFVIYRACGVFVSNLSDITDNQLLLFENVENKKGEKIASLIDKLESKYGNGTILQGDLGIKNVQDKHKREMRYRNILKH